MIDLKEKKLSSKKIFKGDLLDVRKDKVMLPNKKHSYREWVKHPGAACCIPILDNEIIMVEQYRYAVKEVSIELPAGKIDKGESPETCAVRELQEETGYKSRNLTFLTTIYPAIGFSDEKMWIYLAQDLVKKKSKPDIDEFVKVIKLNHKIALKMVENGDITDSKTIIGILWLHNYLNKKI